MYWCHNIDTLDKDNQNKDNHNKDNNVEYNHNKENNDKHNKGNNIKKYYPNRIGVFFGLCAVSKLQEVLSSLIICNMGYTC